MKLLLDTHAFLWAISESGRLSRKARDGFLDRRNSLFLSVASVWEMAIKASLGKLTLSEPLETIVDREMTANAIAWQPIELSHCARVAVLPFHHRDPFDRLLVAQGLVGGLTIVSADAAFDAYGVRRLW